MDSITPPPAKPAGAKDLAKSQKDALKQRLKDLVRDRMGSTGGWHPLSHGQEALWFLWRLAPQGRAYNMALPVGVRGPLDAGALRRALQALHDRHPCLRTAFREENGQARQRGIEGYAVALDPVDAAGWSDGRLRDAVRAEAQRPFDLEAAAAARVTLWRRGPEDHVLLLVVHHIVGDLWSLIVLMDELRTVYAAEKAGRPWSLPAPSLGYEDYVRWEKRMVAGEAAERQWLYWRERLAGELPLLDLPADHKRPPMQSFRGATVTRRIDAGLTGALEGLARSANASLYMVLLAAYMVLLHRYSGQDDLIVGSPTAGRGQPGLPDLFGDFINMVPLRADLSGNPAFTDVLARVRGDVIGALNNGDLPFSLLVDRLQPARDLSRSPIFQTSFVLQKFHRYEELQRTLLPFPDEPEVPFADLRLQPWPLDQQDGQFDLNLEMKKDDAGRLVGAWKYAADLFEPETVARMAGSFEILLRQIVADPAAPVDEMALLTPDEAARAIAGGHGPVVAPPPEPSILALFEAHAARNGGAVAVTCGDDAVTYAALACRVEAAARGLAARGVTKETLVAVAMPRGIGFVTALLAVTKAGGAFLPVDPRQPFPRTVRVLETSAAPLVLTTAALKDAIEGALAPLPAAARPRVAAFEEVAPGAEAALPAPLGGADLAYVMYTSGSTGQPKGVMVEHRGMVNHVLGKLEDLEFGAGDCLAQNAPQSFDVVVWQCLAPLAVGGRVAVIPDGEAENPAALIAEVARRGVTALQIVPAMMRAVIEEAELYDCGPPGLGALRWMVPTGEALPADLCRRWLDLYPAIPILNTYGSTECSDDQCHYRMDRLSAADAVLPVVTIGTPIRNMTAHVLDRTLSPVPPGVVGELYIGGVGVGRGYRGDPARTAASFVPDPFSPEPGARLYKTRDMARRRADGLIDFLGRVDHMIKLRGLRIEPGEIEVALCRHPAVAQASVQARPHPSGERRLVAYLVLSGAHSGPGPEDDELRRFLAGHLPQSMVPEHFRVLDAMPLTANGKLDDKRLPAPDWQAVDEDRFVAPRTPAEEAIAAIWAQALGLERIGVMDDFFAIGGDSIRSIQIAARCQRAGLPMQPHDLFQHRTVAALAEALASRGAEPAVPRQTPVEDAVVQVAAEHLKRAVELVRFDD
ncbi:MAG TPA: amino acid adenylation domain-containing protein [Azospirillum sp.]|nr:amino acid adenylation domain-containing protein [Azospirillum sp.]